jgi:hypothetical protein
VDQVSPSSFFPIDGTLTVFRIFTLALQEDLQHYPGVKPKGTKDVPTNPSAEWQNTIDEFLNW